MSIDICHYCDRPVDTDVDCDCYEPDPRHSLKGYPDICVCERCREKQQDDMDRMNDEPPSNENVLP